MSINEGVYFKPRVGWREYIVIHFGLLCLLIILGIISRNWPNLILIGISILIVLLPFTFKATCKAFSINICPKGITWGGSYQMKYLVSWEEILAIKHVKGYKPVEAIAIVIKAKKLIPKHKRLIILPQDKMDEFIEAIMTYAPDDNPLRVYIQTHYPDSDSGVVLSQES